MITFKHSGNFNNTERFFSKAGKLQLKDILSRYGNIGISALASATPIDSGVTAGSWGYRVSVTRKGLRIIWTNSSINDGVPIVILLQYGHATRGGSYVQGRDFINPAIRPIFDQIAENLWKEVTAL